MSHRLTVKLDIVKMITTFPLLAVTEAHANRCEEVPVAFNTAVGYHDSTWRDNRIENNSFVTQGLFLIKENSNNACICCKKDHTFKETKRIIHSRRVHFLPGT